MTETWAAYATAFTLGVAHALEVDHMVAVSAFVGGETRVGRAAAFGIRWGVGHAAAVLVAGGLLAWSGVSIPQSLERWGETLVGVALVAVGLWAWRNARRLHLHDPSRHGDHAHLHAHAEPARAHGSHVHGHFSMLVGAIHGLAGTAPVVALIPVTLLPTMSAAFAYLLSFGLGTTVGMGAYSALAAVAVSRAAASLRLARAVAFGTAAASVAVGLWWLVIRSK